MKDLWNIVYSYLLRHEHKAIDSKVNMSRDTALLRCIEDDWYGGVRLLLRQCPQRTTCNDAAIRALKNRNIQIYTLLAMYVDAQHTDELICYAFKYRLYEFMQVPLRGRFEMAFNTARYHGNLDAMDIIHEQRRQLSVNENYTYYQSQLYTFSNNVLVTARLRSYIVQYPASQLQNCIWYCCGWCRTDV